MTKLNRWGAIWVGYAATAGAVVVVIVGEAPVLSLGLLASWVVLTKISSRFWVPHLRQPQRVTHYSNAGGMSGIQRDRAIRGTTWRGKNRVRAAAEIIFEGYYPRLWILPKSRADATSIDRCGSLIGSDKARHSIEFDLLAGETVLRSCWIKDILFPWQFYLPARVAISLEHRHPDSTDAEPNREDTPRAKESSGPGPGSRPR